MVVDAAVTMVVTVMVVVVVATAVMMVVLEVEIHLTSVNVYTNNFKAHLLYFRPTKG